MIAIVAFKIALFNELDDLSRTRVGVEDLLECPNDFLLLGIREKLGVIEVDVHLLDEVIDHQSCPDGVDIVLVNAVFRWFIQDDLEQLH